MSVEQPEIDAEFNRLISRVEFDRDTHLELQEQFEALDAAEPYDQGTTMRRRGGGVIGGGKKKLRCKWCNGKLKGEFVQTKYGPFHTDCLDHYEDAMLW